mgnify:CR=1 FL=1
MNDERMRRWRLVLGSEADPETGTTLSAEDRSWIGLIVRESFYRPAAACDAAAGGSGMQLQAVVHRMPA